jgi:hypothetical protein
MSGCAFYHWRQNAHETQINANSLNRSTINLVADG